MQELSRVHLNGLRAAEAVGRLGSLQKAADEIGVTIGALSQHVRRLEMSLGRPLFERTPRGLQPTAFGLEMLPRFSAGFGELEMALRAARMDRSQILTVSVAPVFASNWLVPRLAGFSLKHPGITVRIDASTALVDPDRSDVDLAIRVGAGGWPGVAADLLLPQEVFPVCSPALAERLRTPRDLLDVPIMRDANSTLAWSLWLDAFDIDEKDLQPGDTFTDASLCLQAVISGRGAMLAWQTLAHSALATGQVVAPFAHRARSGLGYYLVHSKRRSLAEPARRFAGWLKDELAPMRV